MALFKRGQRYRIITPDDQPYKVRTARLTTREVQEYRDTGHRVENIETEIALRRARRYGNGTYPRGRLTPASLYTHRATIDRYGRVIGRAPLPAAALDRRDLRDIADAVLTKQARQVAPLANYIRKGVYLRQTGQLTGTQRRRLRHKQRRNLT